MAPVGSKRSRAPAGGGEPAEASRTSKRVTRKTSQAAEAATTAKGRSTSAPKSLGKANRNASALSKARPKPISTARSRSKALQYYNLPVTTLQVGGRDGPTSRDSVCTVLGTECSLVLACSAASTHETPSSCSVALCLTTPSNRASYKLPVKPLCIDSHHPYPRWSKGPPGSSRKYSPCQLNPLQLCPNCMRPIDIVNSPSVRTCFNTLSSPTPTLRRCLSLS